ncbi:MAG: hypothetical protein KH354_08920, partial [Clostridiales bacterium]|nr:hypothetical protein [Clostridiales bacterium]
LILHERNLCLWAAYASLSYIHRILIAHYALGKYSALKTQKLTGISFQKMYAESAAAIQILRRLLNKSLLKKVNSQLLWLSKHDIIQ